MKNISKCCGGLLNKDVYMWLNKSATFFGLTVSRLIIENSDNVNAVATTLV